MYLAFWLGLLVVASAYLFYPLLMAGLAMLKPRPIAVDADWLPMADVLLVVHDAASQVGAKIENLLRLDYPEDRLRVHVICDGCRDGTDQVAAAIDSRRVHVTAHPQRRGKAACLADALPLLKSEVVLFTDVRQPLEPEALRALTAALADPAVGVASGELVLEAHTGYGKGVDAYWRFEKMLRRLESRSGSIVGATGALYAARREAIAPPPAGTILDDMWIPLTAAANGARLVSVPGAIAYDHGARDAASEELRKRRTLAGNYQLLHRWPALALPGAHPLALRLWGHKWVRLLAPLGLILTFLSSAWLARDSMTFAGILIAQLIAYGLALLGRYWPALGDRLFLVRLCTAFASLNLSALLALVDYLRNRNGHLWATPRQSAPAVASSSAAEPGTLRR